MPRRRSTEPSSPISIHPARWATRSSSRRANRGRRRWSAGKHGRLTGGNLTLISSTLGTRYAIEPKGKILFIEDVHEAPYRIDRFLSQLRLAGVLDGIAGVVAGEFTTGDPNHAKEFDRILREYFVPMNKPIVTHFPVGHITNNATLPVGALVQLDADTGTLRLLENPVRLDRERPPRAARASLPVTAPELLRVPVEQ